MAGGLSEARFNAILNGPVRRKLSHLTVLQIIRAALATDPARLERTRDAESAVWQAVLLASTRLFCCSHGSAFWAHLPAGQPMLMWPQSGVGLHFLVFSRSGKRVVVDGSFGGAANWHPLGCGSLHPAEEDTAAPLATLLSVMRSKFIGVIAANLKSLESLAHRVRHCAPN